jgi:hypothetical protein
MLMPVDRLFMMGRATGALGYGKKWKTEQKGT